MLLSLRKLRKHKSRNLPLGWDNNDVFHCVAPKAALNDFRCLFDILSLACAALRACARQVVSASESATFFPTRERERKNSEITLTLVQSWHISGFFQKKNLFFPSFKKFQCKAKVKSLFCNNHSFSFWQVLRFSNPEMSASAKNSKVTSASAANFDERESRSQS